MSSSDTGHGDERGSDAATGSNRRAARGAVSRRAFAKVAGASVTAGALAGVAGTATAQDDGGATTVQWAADQLAADNADAINQSLHDNGLSEDVTVEVIAGVWETGQRRDQYQQWLSAGRPQPDMLNMDNGWHQPFIVRDQQLNLSEAMPEEVTQRVREEYQDRAVASATGPDGDLYGIPLFIDVGTVQYRKDLVEEAGYDPEGENWATEPISWQQFSQVVSEVKQANDMQYGFNFQAQAYEGLSCCVFNEFMSSWGGAYFGPLENLFGPVGERPVTVDEEPVVNAVRMLQQFIQGESGGEGSVDVTGDISPEAVLQWTEPTSLRPFSNGEAVALRNWPFAIEETGADDVFGEDLGVMPIPYGVTAEEAQYQGTGGVVAALGGFNLGVNPDTQNQEATLEVVRTMTNDQFQLDLFETIGWSPPKPDLLNTDAAQDIPTLGRYLDTIQLAVENAIPRPTTVVWPQESEQISQAINGLASGTEDPAPQLQQLASRIEQIEQSA